MIVSLTRSDLREEFKMAEEAFALSPISARAAQPSDEDYAAISEAFMETSRGRWFLGEYAKRNRNADTSMVLDAVARIEQSLAAQKEEHQAAQQQAAAAEQAAAAAERAELALAEALATIRNAVDAAQASAIAALDGFALEHKLVPLRKGARVMREIAWRLREIGNDGRICDLIDSQVAVIETSVEQISTEDAKAALSAAFVSLEERLAEIGDDGAAAPVSEAPAPVCETSAPVSELIVAESLPVPPEETPVAVAQVVQVAPAYEALEAPTDPMASTTAEATLVEVETAEVTDVTDSDVTDEAAIAHDEAVLDMIAQEMGAPEPYEVDEMAAMIAEEAHIAEHELTEPQIVADAPELVAEQAEPPVEMPPQEAVEAAPEPAFEVSLGSSIIASGLVRTPSVPANDPLAPIRRMSQAEKIAFFS